MAAQGPQQFQQNPDQGVDDGTSIGIIVGFDFFVLLAILMLICACWVVHRYRQHSRGLAATESLPVSLHGPSTAEEVECCVCLTKFEEGAKVKVLPACYHTFHPDCIDKWLMKQSTCPLCRAFLQISPDNLVLFMLCYHTPEFVFYQLDMGVLSWYLDNIVDGSVENSRSHVEAVQSKKGNLLLLVNDDDILNSVQSFGREEKLKSP